MDQATHNKIVSFIWGIADDVLRDLFVRGKYRDVIYQKRSTLNVQRRTSN
jgi:type I restriction-modification system DNA methylase subunit